MQAFDLADLMENRRRADKLYLEFIRVPDLSAGIYGLPAGGTDPQSPHAEDEIYYVVKGKAKIRVGSEERLVQAGSVVYVAKNVEHRFHSVEGALTFGAQPLKWVQLYAAQGQYLVGFIVEDLDGNPYPVYTTITVK